MNNINKYLLRDIEENAKIISRYQKEYGQIIQEQSKRLEPFLRDISQQIQKQIVVEHQLWEAATKQIRNVIESIDFASISKTFEENFKLFREFEENDKFERSYIERLAEAGWPPLLDVPVSFISDANEEYEKLGKEKFKEELSKAIIEYYKTENIRIIQDRWKTYSFINRRIKILNDAIDAHLDGKYTLSIPAILPQIEGTLNDCLSQNIDADKKKIAGYIDYILEDHDRYLPIKALIIDDLYAKFHWGDEFVPALSRHAILHGANTTYCVHENSLKIILIYDMLVYLIDINNNSA